MNTLAFDLGKVIFDFDYNVALKRLEGRINVDPLKLLELIYKNNFGLHFEKGLVSPQEFYKEFKRDFQAKISYDEFTSIWSEIFTPKEDVINLVAELKSKYPIFLISNINQLHYEYLSGHHPQVFTLFKRLILSYQVKSVKPEPAIYQELQRAAGVSYNQIIYIDDRTDLIEAANRLGLQSILFTDYKRLVKDLAKLGIL
jgi:putative hydrolase of the HAD superfamily